MFHLPRQLVREWLKTSDKRIHGQDDVYFWEVDLRRFGSPFHPRLFCLVPVCPLGSETEVQHRLESPSWLSVVSSVQELQQLVVLIFTQVLGSFQSSKESFKLLVMVFLRSERFQLETVAKFRSIFRWIVRFWMQERRLKSKSVSIKSQKLSLI